MTGPGTLTRDISPPPLRRSTTITQTSRVAGARRPNNRLEEPRPAAVEAGEAEVRDHVAYFVQHLSTASRPPVGEGPRLLFSEFENLYNRNQHPHGRHFVVHQHDHPVSGVHYDLRLQFSATSSVSFAIPYGLPGNPNSLRPNRMAIETRVHNLWNHLIESASHATGSLLIWDTGEYEVLPRAEHRERTTDDELSDVDLEEPVNPTSQSEKLIEAFRSRYIRLRLNGRKLPRNYTISLRLPSANDRVTPPNMRKRKRRHAEPVNEPMREVPSDSEMHDGNPEQSGAAASIASDDEQNAALRTNNAYTGASNTIGSIHQRHWFLTLDRARSGFVKARSGPDAGSWAGNWPPFVVRGRDHERSVVTGRLADEVMADEGVGEFVGRKMWRAIVE